MEELDIKFKNLSDWITRNNGWVNPKLKLVQTEKFGKCVISNQQIEPEEQLFLVNKKLHLNPENSNLQDYRLSEIFEYRDQVVIALLVECQNPETKWRDYVVLLPQLFDYLDHPLVLYYQNKFPNLSGDIYDRVTVLFQTFNQFREKLQNFNSVTPIFQQLPNFDECLWGFLTVITRMWAGCGLVPVADHLQHSNSSLNILESREGDFSSMTSKSTIPAQTPVYDNYLVQDDITLYVNFGFIDTTSDITNLSLGFNFETQNPLVASIINSHRSKFESKKLFISTQGINSDLMAILRLHMLDLQDLKIGQFDTENFYNQIISLNNELRSLQKLRFRINHLINQNEFDFIKLNYANYEQLSPEWAVSTLIFKIDSLKSKTEEFIIDYWKSFI